MQAGLEHLQRAGLVRAGDAGLMAVACWGSLHGIVSLILDGQARYTRAVGGVRATLGVVFENLTGLQYEVIPSYVMPPRHLRVRLLLQSR